MDWCRSRRQLLDVLAGHMWWSLDSSRPEKVSRVCWWWTWNCLSPLLFPLWQLAEWRGSVWTWTWAAWFQLQPEVSVQWRENHLCVRRSSERISQFIVLLNYVLLRWTPKYIFLWLIILSAFLVFGQYRLTFLSLCGLVIKTEVNRKKDNF